MRFHELNPVSSINRRKPRLSLLFSQNEVRYGSSGKDVYELQGRLKYLGYYYGKVDSDFGEKTLGSVKWFQSEFGMKADGIVGASTKLKLYNATKDWRPTEPGPGLVYSGGGGKGGNTGQGNNTGGTDNSMGSNNSLGLTENEIKLMANAVYGEARGEPFEGQVAVAAVILNRVKAPQFPDTPSGVIFELELLQQLLTDKFGSSQMNKLEKQ